MDRSISSNFASDAGGGVYATVGLGGRCPIMLLPCLYWEHEGNAALRLGDYKLVREYEKPWELYDLSNDRTELINLAASKQQQTSALIRQWESWAKDTGVAFPERFNMYRYLREKQNNK